MHFLQLLNDKPTLNIFINDNNLLIDLQTLPLNQKCNIYIYTNGITNSLSYKNFNYIYIHKLPEKFNFDLILLNSDFILSQLYQLQNIFTYIISPTLLNNLNKQYLIKQYKNLYIYINPILNNIITNQNKQQSYILSNISPINNSNKKLGVIYTANIGGYDKFLHHDIYDLNNFDYIYLTLSTNKQIIPSPWKVQYIDEFLPIIDLENKNDIIRIARWCKLHPHIIFTEYDLSIWVDGNTKFIDEPTNLLKNIQFDYLLSQMHPARNCIYEEAKTCIKLKADNKDIINKEIEFLRQENYPENNGLVQTNILVRKHNNQNCIKYMNYWWYFIKNYSRRDQLSFNYIAWKYNLTFTAILYKEMTDKYIHWNAIH